MNNASGVPIGLGLKRHLQFCGRTLRLFPLIAVAFLLLPGPLTHAQTTAQLTGTVQDSSGGVIPGSPGNVGR